MILAKRSTVRRHNGKAMQGAWQSVRLASVVCESEDVHTAYLEARKVATELLPCTLADLDREFTACVL